MVAEAALGDVGVPPDRDAIDRLTDLRGGLATMRRVVEL